MSLQSSMAVMKAKLAGNVPQLQALAMQGDFEAVAALKELTDKKAYAQGMANETAMGQGDTLPVLEQLVGNLEAPQSGIAAYAGGGRAFSGQDGSWNEPDKMSLEEQQRLYKQRNTEQRNAFFRSLMPGGGAGASAPLFRGDSPFDRAMSSLGDLFQWKGNAPAKPEAPAYPDTVSIREAQQAGSAYPEPVQARSPATNKATVRKPSYSGIAAVAAPASPPSDGPFDPKKRMQRQEGAGMPDLPDASTMSDSQLRVFLAKQEPLQKKRDELDELSRKQLEAAYNAKVKNLTPSKFDRVMEFLAGVSAKGGSSAAQALGAGALAMHGKDKARQEQMASVKEAYDKADILIQQAQVERQLGNNAAAYKLEQEAAALQKQIAAQKSTEKLQEAQAGYYDAQTAYTRDTKPVVETIRANKAGRSGIAAGVKPPNPVQVEAKIQSRTAQLMKADPFNPMPEAQARAQAEREVRASIAGKPASPAAPSGGVKFLGFE
jgi:hypothetical protein